MGIILGEAAHAHQTVHYTAAFVAVNRAFFCIAQGQIAVRAQGILVNVDMERAVHRLQEILLPIDIHRGVHVLFVKTQVTAGLPELCFTDMGCIDKIVTGGFVFFGPEVFDQLADFAALGMPQDQSCADLIDCAKQIQVMPQLAVIAFLGFFHAPQIILQFCRFFPGSAVDALQHGTFFIPAPVCAGDGEQF